MNRIIFLLVVLGLSSCATLLNTPSTKIDIYTDRPSNITVEDNTYERTSFEGISVNRSPDSLKIVVQQDTITKEFFLKPKYSSVYLSNILFAYGAGFIVDARTNKKFTYQSPVFLDFKTNKVLRRRPGKKNQLDLIVSFPYINSFLLQPPGESVKINTGFMGINGGLEYYYLDNRSIAVNVGGVLDMFIPFPAPVDFMGDWEFMSSFYTSITNNIKYKNYSFGYGLNYSKNNWQLNHYGDENSTTLLPPNVFKSSKTLGLTFNAYYATDSHIDIGLVYRPTVMRITPNPTFLYEHVISIDVVLRFKMMNQSFNKVFF